VIAQTRDLFSVVEISQSLCDMDSEPGLETPRALRYFRWHGLFARQTLQILLRESNSFPKQGASENFGSRMIAG